MRLSSEVSWKPLSRSTARISRRQREPGSALVTPSAPVTPWYIGSLPQRPSVSVRGAVQSDPVAFLLNSRASAVNRSNVLTSARNIPSASDRLRPSMTAWARISMSLESTAGHMGEVSERDEPDIWVERAQIGGIGGDDLLAAAARTDDDVSVDDV
jgi:hypothetical protein